MKTVRSNPQSGYAVPTILILSIALMTIGLTVLQVSLDTQKTLQIQQYDRLAREAGEAGTAMANACLSQNNGTAQWTTAKPLMPQTDCTGTPRCGNPTPTCTPSQVYVVAIDNVHTSFTVAPPDNLGRISSAGTTQQLSGSGSVAQTYAHTTVGMTGAGNNLATKTVATNGSQTFVIGTDGNVYGAGLDISTSSAAVQKMSLPPGVTARSISTGGSYSTPTSVVRCTITWPYGIQPPGCVPLGQPVNVVGCNSYSQMCSHANNTLLVIGSDGNVYGSGANTCGQLGDDAVTNCGDAGYIYVPLSAPVKFVLPAGVSAQAINANGSSSFVFGSDGNVYGAGWYASVGSGGYSVFQTPPVKLKLPVGVTVKSMTDSGELMVVGSDGKVYGVGWDKCDALGDGSAPNGCGNSAIGDHPYYMVAPAKFNLDAIGGSIPRTGQKVISLFSSSFVLGSDGNVYGAGYNITNDPHASTSTFLPTPIKMPLPAGITVRNVTGSPSSLSLPQVFVIGSDGNVYGGGQDGCDELGDEGSLTFYPLYQQFTGGCTTYPDGPSYTRTVKFNLPVGVSARSVGANANQSFVMGSDGNVYGAGYNVTAIYNSPWTHPVRLQLPSGVTPQSLTVAAGGIVQNSNGYLNDAQVVLMVGSDGSVYGFGQDDCNQLGDGGGAANDLCNSNTTYRSFLGQPVQFKLPAGVKAQVPSPGTGAGSVSQRSPIF